MLHHRQYGDRTPMFLSMDQIQTKVSSIIQSCLKVTQLKVILRSLNLTISGRKDALIARILTYLRNSGRRGGPSQANYLILFTAAILEKNLDIAVRNRRSVDYKKPQFTPVSLIRSVVPSVESNPLKYTGKVRIQKWQVSVPHNSPHSPCFCNDGRKHNYVRCSSCYALRHLQCVSSLSSKETNVCRLCQVNSFFIFSKPVEHVIRPRIVTDNSSPSTFNVKFQLSSRQLSSFSFSEAHECKSCQNKAEAELWAGHGAWDKSNPLPIDAIETCSSAKAEGVGSIKTVSVKTDSNEMKNCENSFIKIGKNHGKSPIIKQDSADKNILGSSIDKKLSRKIHRYRHALYVACVDFSGVVPKLRWPQFSSLQSNGTSSAELDSKLNINAPANISRLVRHGMNTLKISVGADSIANENKLMVFVFIAQYRPTEDVVTEITTNKACQISISSSKNKFMRMYGNSNSPKSRARSVSIASDDEAFECLETDLRIPIRCPLGMCVMDSSERHFPVRGKRCKHFQCFDLYTFLAYNRQKYFEYPAENLTKTLSEKEEKRLARKWRCPHCNEICRPQDLMYDLYICDIIRKAVQIDAEMDQVRLLPDGSWLPPEKHIKRNSVGNNNSLHSNSDPKISMNTEENNDNCNSNPNISMTTGENDPSGTETNTQIPINTSNSNEVTNDVICLSSDSEDEEVVGGSSSAPKPTGATAVFAPTETIAAFARAPSGRGILLPNGTLVSKDTLLQRAVLVHQLLREAQRSRNTAPTSQSTTTTIGSGSGSSYMDAIELD